MLLGWVRGIRVRLGAFGAFVVWACSVVGLLQRLSQLSDVL